MNTYREFIISWTDGKSVIVESFWNAVEYIQFRRFLISNDIRIIG
jgi:hypothetical protein